MVVDDSLPIKAALRQVAEEHGHIVVGEAENGKEAFAVGVHGYLLKSPISSELSQAIESVRNQQLYRSWQLAS